MMRTWRFLTALLLIPALLLGAIPGRTAGAEYYMQLAYMMVADYPYSSTQAYDGSVIDRFTNRFEFAFHDRLDPASVAPSVAVTGPDGSTLSWQAEVQGARFYLYPPEMLLSAAQYTIRIRGGQEGIKNADGAPMRDDRIFRLTTDDTPFSFTRVVQTGGDGPEELGDGAVLPRNAREVELSFSHPVTAESVARAIKVTRQNGEDAGWQSEVRGRRVILSFPGRLPRAEETYTLQIAGGPEGLLDRAGQSLPQSLTRTVRTLDRAYSFTRSFATNWKQHGALQNEVWRIRADAGPLNTRLIWDGKPAVLRLMIVDEEQDEVIFHRNVFLRGEATLLPTLPRAGQYILYLMENKAVEVTVSGMELEMDPETPALSVPPITEFEITNQPFDVAGTVKNPTETKAVGIYLEDQTLWEGAPSPDGAFGPGRVDPTGLPDGVYYLDIAGAAGRSQNVSFTSVPLLVDRVESFHDVPAWHWARPYVEAMHDLGVVNGRGTGYAPQETVTRAEFAKMLALTLQLEASPETVNPFVDVPENHWAKPYILALWEYGLAAGTVVDGQRYFYPSRNISRAEAATMIGRALGLDRIYPEGRPFTDWDAVPSWAQPSVLALSVMGWINGFQDGSYRPGENLQRDQAAKILAQFYT